MKPNPCPSAMDGKLGATARSWQTWLSYRHRCAHAVGERMQLSLSCCRWLSPPPALLSFEHYQARPNSIAINHSAMVPGRSRRRAT